MDNRTTITRIMTFLAVAEAGDFARASRKLGVGGDGASTKDLRKRSWQDCRNLSQDIYGPNTKVKLFERSLASVGRSKTMNLALTEEGKAVHAQATRVRDAIDGLMALGVAPSSARLACFPAHVRSIVAEVLADLQGAPAGRSLEALEVLEVLEAEDSDREDAGAALRDRLARGLVDVVIAPTREDPRLESEPLYAWRMVAVLPPGHDLARRHVVGPQELASEHLLLSPPGHVSHELVIQAFQDAGIVPNTTLVNGSTEVLLALAGKGLGVALLPSDAVWRREGVVQFTERAVSGTHSLYWRTGDGVRSEVSDLLGAFRFHRDEHDLLGNDGQEDRKR